MAFSLNTRKLALAASLLAALCLFAFGTAEGQARSTGKVAAATALKPLSPAAAKCRKLAASRSRSAASRAARPATAHRIARRVRAQFLRRCMRQQRSKRAKASVLPTDVGGPLAIGIDGGYTGWSETEIEERAELGAAVTRHEWDPASRSTTRTT